MSFLWTLLVLCTSLLTYPTFAWEDLAPLHSHNDYLQKEPLTEALANKFGSIEIDVWLSRGEVKIAHWPWNYKGTLRETYLSPLQKLVDEKKLRFTQDHPLLLWIDIKDVRNLIVDKLGNDFEQYPMIGKEVVVVVTGNRRLKKKLFNEYPRLNLERDENDLGREGRQTWFTLNWKKFFKWDGRGEMPLEEKEKLKALVGEIHSSGRKLRFYSSPDTRTYWKLINDMKVDLIDTDRIQQLGRFWREIKGPSR